jgi:hypothetical protein
MRRPKLGWYLRPVRLNRSNCRNNSEDLVRFRNHRFSISKTIRIVDNMLSIGGSLWRLKAYNTEESFKYEENAKESPKYQSEIFYIHTEHARCIPHVH